MPVTIQDVKVITTQPGRSRLIIVKIITSEPGLYGLGCATFTQRWHAVVAAIENHLKPFVLGRDVSRIEELYRMMTVHSYWRNGPVLNNAISGIDQALWDIKGKMAGMPVYDLLGGKVREAANVYVHADGSSPEEVAENVQKFMDEGHRHIRIQMGGYGGKDARMVKPDGAPDGAYYDPRDYCRRMLKMMEHVRKTVGDEVELLHDIHERLMPIDAVRFAKDVEPFNLFFLEDALAPEDIDYVRRGLRWASCSTTRMNGGFWSRNA
jgi:mannonate dehydratase